MAAFRETRNALLLAHSVDIIPDKKFVLLYEPHTSKNLDYTYWSYNRFLKGDVYRLFEVSDIPEESNCYYRSNFNELERFSVFLKRLLIFVAILIWCQVSEDQCLKHV